MRQPKIVLFCFLSSLLVAVGGVKVSETPDSIVESIDFPGSDPSLVWGADGKLHVSYVKDTPEGPRIAYKGINCCVGNRCRKAKTTESSIVSPVSLNIVAHGEMPPTVEVLPDGTIVMTYAVRLPIGRRKTEIYVQRSTDGGLTWNDPVLLHDDGMVGGHAFLDTVLNAQGEVVFSWIDPREGQQGLATSWSKDGVKISANKIADSRTCQCCNTSLCLGTDGEVWLAYRDLRDQNTRDISIVKSLDGGRSFGPPNRVSDDGWEVNGCPHTGPRLTQDHSGALWVTWFTGSTNRIYVARSDDGGSSFGQRFPITGPMGQGGTVRHPEIGTLPGGRVVVLYEVRGKEENVIAARIRDGRTGEWSDPKIIAEDAIYPRYSARGDRAVVAFTDRSTESEPRVHIKGWKEALHLSRD